MNRFRVVVIIAAENEIIARAAVAAAGEVVSSEPASQDALAAPEGFEPTYVESENISCESWPDGIWLAVPKGVEYEWPQLTHGKHGRHWNSLGQMPEGTLKWTEGGWEPLVRGDWYDEDDDMALEVADF